jgi:hypothetical protein
VTASERLAELGKKFGALEQHMMVVPAGGLEEVLDEVEEFLWTAGREIHRIRREFR